MNTPSQLFMAFHKDQLHKRKDPSLNKLTSNQSSPEPKKEG